jgi:putative endonuclease
MPPDQAYVYILANGYKRLYTGVTTTLAQRVREHKEQVHPESFTARYNIHQLVYYECHETISRAIAREKEIKALLRVKKIQLIVSLNPEWRDLSLEWGRAIEPFDETKMNLPPDLWALAGSSCRPRQNTGILRFAQNDGPPRFLSSLSTPSSS